MISTLIERNKMPPIDELNEHYYYDGTHLRNKINKPGRGGGVGSIVGTKGGSGQCMKHKGARFYVHRIIYYMATGHDPGDLVIDHINRNPRDNRIENLRAVTQEVNLQNRTKSDKGVYTCKARQKNVKKKLNV